PGSPGVALAWPASRDGTRSRTATTPLRWQRRLRLRWCADGGTRRTQRERTLVAPRRAPAYGRRVRRSFVTSWLACLAVLALAGSAQATRPSGYRADRARL